MKRQESLPVVRFKQNIQYNNVVQKATSKQDQCYLERISFQYMVPMRVRGTLHKLKHSTTAFYECL